MAICNACGLWVASTNPNELCKTCKSALRQLKGYAVPVVRCKDCKHQIEKSYAQYRYKWCTAWHGINGMGDEGYCNYGERKDNERKAD